MKQNGWKNFRLAFWSAVCLCLSLRTTPPASANASETADGQKAKVRGVIISGSGNLINIEDEMSGAIVVIKVGATTRVVRDREFFRHTATNLSALVQGLTIEAKGIGNADGQLQATKITFTPDLFADEFAEKQRVYVYLQQQLGKVQPR